MSELFRVQRLVEFADTDMAGIVHFSQFFRYMESAEHAYLRACGLSVMLEWEGEHLTFPRVAASCDYARPARFEDVLDVTVRVERIGRSSIAYAFEFFKGEAAIAKGGITCVCCRVGPGHALEGREVPATLRERLQSVPGQRGHEFRLK